MKNIITTSIIALLMTGCASVSNKKIAEYGYNIPKEILKEHSGSIIVDDLEKRFYYSDTEYWDFLLGTAYKRITFTYHPDSVSNVKKIRAEFRSMTKEWAHSKWISVYVNGEKIINQASNNRRTSTSIVNGGSAGNTVYTHEHYTVPISIELAKKIAHADSDSVTIRFGGGNAGYVDDKPHPLATMNGLKSVIALTETTTKI
ncbi:hypothetical protein L2729_09240 [Shewanella gelidimarina]|uniref:hypothetical protein n=1 Tax=Shewanella gelidimarina TaxID=56813 RepID=UPI00200E4917|nr:hypothetical protein [Shewanella gelidimarina]MCL1058186.1 hypothetical protein [Shewanella gelidimarina]